MTTCRPNYYKYSGQHQAQGASLTIYENGEVGTDWNGEIGGAVSVRVWKNIDMMFGIDNGLTEHQINELIDIIKPMALDLLHNSHVEWDGNNLKRFFSDRAEDLHNQIASICENFETDDYDHCGSDDCKYCNREEN